MPRAYRLSLWLVLTLALALGSFVILYHAAHMSTYTIDSYFYLSKAKQLAGGQGLRTTWNDGVDTKYFPGYSIVLAFSFLLGGSYVPVQVVSYLLCAALLLSIMRELEFGPAERTLAATALAVNPIVVKWLSVPMAEVAALTLALLSVSLFLAFTKTKRYPLLFAACMVGGVAAITRVESLFLLVLFGAMIIPARKTVSWPRLLAGAALFLLPLLAYWVRLRSAGAEGPAYLKEFRGTFLRFDLLKNFAYNVWAPFGFQRQPLRHLGTMPFFSVAALAGAFAGAIWFGLGELFFLLGLAWSLLGRLGHKVRAAGLLFLAYALLHSFWYYRYERFMFTAVPLAAIVWAAAVHKIFLFVKGKREGGWWVLILAQLLVAATGLYWGNHYSSLHRMELREDTSRLDFQDIAAAVNALNQERSAVLTDLGPHLAYYLDAHTYMDTDHGNYWHRAFPPERTLEEMNRLGIGFVVTGKDLDEWLEGRAIPSDARGRFKDAGGPVEGASIAQYTP